MSSKILLEQLATEKMFCKKLVQRTSEVFQKCNFRYQDEIDAL